MKIHVCASAYKKNDIGKEVEITKKKKHRQQHVDGSKAHVNIIGLFFVIRKKKMLYVCLMINFYLIQTGQTKIFLLFRVSFLLHFFFFFLLKPLMDSTAQLRLTKRQKNYYSILKKKFLFFWNHNKRLNIDRLNLKLANSSWLLIDLISIVRKSAFFDQEKKPSFK